MDGAVRLYGPALRKISERSIAQGYKPFAGNFRESRMAKGPRLVTLCWTGYPGATLGTLFAVLPKGA
jgi:hypothetical protein